MFKSDLAGWLAVITPADTSQTSNVDAPGAPCDGVRTLLTGTVTFDSATYRGDMTITPCSFLGGGDAIALDIPFRDIDGADGAGTLLPGNMIVDAAGTAGIPPSIVRDGRGVLDAIARGLAVGASAAASNADFACAAGIACATSATNDFPFMCPCGSRVFPVGAAPLVTATRDSTDIGVVTNPGGTLPLIADTIGGSSSKAGPFTGMNPNFDFDCMTVTAPPFVSVSMDIKPGSADFDALSVVPSTASHAGASMKMVGKSDRDLCHAEDVDMDGFTDPLCQVYTARFMLKEGESAAILEAETGDGMKVRGEDVISGLLRNPD